MAAAAASAAAAAAAAAAAEAAAYCIALPPEVAHPKIDPRLDGGTGAPKSTLRFPSAAEGTLVPPSAAAAAAATAAAASAASGLSAGEVDNAPNLATAFAGDTSAPEPTLRFGAATAAARNVAALPTGATHASEAFAFAFCSPASAPGSPTIATPAASRDRSPSRRRTSRCSHTTDHSRRSLEAAA